MIIPFLDHPDLAIINVLNDAPPPMGDPRSCQMWGEEEYGDEENNDSIPIIINEDTSGWGAPGLFNDWFSGPGAWNEDGLGIMSSPWYIFIDKDFKYVHLAGEGNTEIINKLNELLVE